MTFQELKQKLTRLIGASRAEEIVSKCKNDGYEESDCCQLWLDLQEDYRDYVRSYRCGY